ncbi:Uncharacterized protein APZ42_025086 [Daphnia magna]|uniref:Uncharacterized protein n=1 Tax=Daphnia magna TaxID=35525 RepID=A0A164TGP7_9CRUS|nr:Uncharacterized protein APZ42_025086 [Daphnia magna]
MNFNLTNKFQGCLQQSLRRKSLKAPNLKRRNTYDEFLQTLVSIIITGLQQPKFFLLLLEGSGTHEDKMLLLA